MKINQLFTQLVEQPLLDRLLSCYNLRGLADRRQFCKADLTKAGTVSQFQLLTDELRGYYLPCKARVYLDDLDERKCITVLRQILRLHCYSLFSKERNVNNKKVMYYQLVHESERTEPVQLKVLPMDQMLCFE